MIGKGDTQICEAFHILKKEKKECCIISTMQYVIF